MKIKPMKPSLIFLRKLLFLIGGRAAEELVLGEISTGASADLKQANQIARSMIIKFGMSEIWGTWYLMRTMKYS
jgi:ATP-dependent Zn protease